MCTCLTMWGGEGNVYESKKSNDKRRKWRELAVRKNNRWIEEKKNVEKCLYRLSEKENKDEKIYSFLYWKREFKGKSKKEREGK